MSPKSKKPYKKAYLEITNVCNLSCAFCPKTSREPRFVSVEEFAALIEQVQPLTDYVYLHLMGEPLLHPQLGSNPRPVPPRGAEGVADHQRQPFWQSGRSCCFAPRPLPGQRLAAQL